MKNNFLALRLLLPIFVLLGLASCANLKYNYLGRVKRQPNIPQNIYQLDSSRRVLDIQCDSLLQTISVKKQENRHLSAQEVNLLSSNFGSQLEYDRFFNSMLQSSSLRRRFLTPMQRYAGARLLYAASIYDRSYQQNKVARRTLNLGDRGNQIPRNTLQKARKFLYSSSIRKKLSYKKKGELSDAADTVLQLLPATNCWKETVYSLFRKNDRISSFIYNTFSLAGNSFFASVASRYTDRRKQMKYATQLLSVLQPYDILLSRAPGHLASKVIPGYYGHAAIWLDNEVTQKKRFLNILKNENSTRFKLREKGMAEALRNGVQLSNLQEFADGDEFVVLRLRTLSSEQKTHIMENTMKQMHKGYDFNFDVELTNKVNCTKLVFLAYDFIDWDVRYFMHRYTVLPDDILLTALKNKEFEIVALLKNGELTRHPDAEYIHSFIK
jgi:hypothetical protein